MDLQQQSVQNNPVLQSQSEEDNQGIPFQDLPQTECPHGMQCVMEQFCDNAGIISSTRRELSEKDKKEREELIPCINTATAMFDVCCKLQKTQAIQSPARIKKTTSNIKEVSVSSVKKSPCPVIHSLPPVSSCAGQSSSCFNVGKNDADCGGRVCCFNGCANICISQKNSSKEETRETQTSKEIKTKNKIPRKISEGAVPQCYEMCSKMQLQGFYQQHYCTPYTAPGGVESTS